MIRHLLTLQVSLFVTGRGGFLWVGVEPDSENGAHVETFWRLLPPKSREVIENHFVVRDTLARRRFILMLVGCAPLLKSVMSLSEVSWFFLERCPVPSGVVRSHTFLAGLPLAQQHVNIVFRGQQVQRLLLTWKATCNMQ